MSAYVIVDIEVLDPVLYEEYKRLASISIATHGGTYRVRGGASEVFEGDRQPGRLVVLEFPTLEAARGWHDSEEYTTAKEIRVRCARVSMIAVEGLAPA